VNCRSCGFALSRKDLLGAIVMGLMCQGGRQRPSSCAPGLQAHFARAERLAELEARGRQARPGRLELTDIGWYFVRAVAMVFDLPLQTDRARERYSRVI
jgi:oxygen-independent coproporphyrinogen-3 oxidase